jgi:AcrR family transcriptional regulator
MKPRIVKGGETRLRIIRTAADLFHKQGARATSPDEIIEASRTGKGQFYHYFKSKEGLVHEVLQTYLNEIKAGTSQVNYEINSWRDLEKWFLAHIGLQKHYEMTRGCPFGTLGNEVTENDELIRQDVSLIFEVVKNKLTAFFVKEKAKGRLAKKVNEEELADFCIATIQGGMLLGKIKRDSRPVEIAVREGMIHLRRFAVSPNVEFLLLRIPLPIRPIRA